MIVSVGSWRGTGTTTAALLCAVAAADEQPVWLIEADPAGGVLAGRLTIEGELVGGLEQLSFGPEQAAAVVKAMAEAPPVPEDVPLFTYAASEVDADARLHNALEIIRDPSHVRMLSKSELHGAITQADLVVEDAVTWTNHREFEEWMKIVDEPTRIGPLKVVMMALLKASTSSSSSAASGRSRTSSSTTRRPGTPRSPTSCRA